MDAERRALRATCLVLAPAAAVIAGIGPQGIAAAVALSCAAAALEARPRLGRTLALLGVAVAVMGGIWRDISRPSVALVLLLWGSALASRVLPGRQHQPGSPCATAARWVTLTLSVAWLVGRGAAVPELTLLTLSAILPAAFARFSPAAIAAMGIPIALLVVDLIGVRPEPGPAVLVLGPAFLLRSPDQPSPLRNGLSFWLRDPVRLLVTSFLALCLLGTVLLSLPYADPGGQGHSLIDAAFTAVSAACVTGLIVLDTPNDFTLFGTVVLAGLIQVGGLGIMTFAAAALLSSGGRLTVREESAATDLLGDDARADLPGTLVRIFAVTVITEFIGALLLAPSFWMRGDSVLMAAWRALFTAVSAFSNAGFALQSDSLVPFQDHPYVLLVISAIIIVGGLGPMATLAVPDWLRGGPVSLQVRLVLVTTLALNVAPAVGYLALEWSNTLAGMDLSERLANAWFQSVTLRTAGFNSVDLSQVGPATLVILIVVMFVGGSPGSTAGGVKTTTIAVLLLGVFATARGRTAVRFAGRRVPLRALNRANAIIAVAIFSIIFALLAILLTQRLSFTEALFEVVSALATAGLSIGGSAQLDGVGKIIIIGCMFAGRVGPLTLFLFLTQSRAPSIIEYPEEDVVIG